MPFPDRTSVYQMMKEVGPFVSQYFVRCRIADYCTDRGRLGTGAYFPTRPVHPVQNQLLLHYTSNGIYEYVPFQYESRAAW